MFLRKYTPCGHMPFRAVIAILPPLSSLDQRPLAIHITANQARSFSRSYELPKRISPVKWSENLKKIRSLKEKLGSKYRIWGRDNRRSSITKRKCLTTPSQPPPKENVKPLFEKYLYRGGEQLPAPLPVIEKPCINEPPHNFCAFNITKKEYDFLFDEVPNDLKRSLHEVAEARGEMTPDLKKLVDFIPEQVKMLQKLLDIRNAPKKQIWDYNDAVLKYLFNPHDSDNPLEYVIAKVSSNLYNLRCQTEKKEYKKSVDRFKAIYRLESRRLRLLKSLRRTNLESFVNMCKQIGVDPHSIRSK